RRLAVDDDVGDDERSGDRAAPRPDAGHADGRVTGDHRLDLLGVHLLAADVDDAAPTTEEVVALTASLDDVAGIHEALVIARADGLMSARRQCDGVPEMCVTPRAPSRTR